MYSVPKRCILKEVQKYFDEFGSRVEELYFLDENHYMDFVKHQLRKEFSYEQIEDPKTTRKIRYIFMEVWNSKTPQKNLKTVCEELFCQNPNADLNELIKIFAKTYPCKKIQFHKAYYYFTQLKGGNKKCH